jgi:hypothetical protein
MLRTIHLLYRPWALPLVGAADYITISNKDRAGQRQSTGRQRSRISRDMIGLDDEAFPILDTMVYIFDRWGTTSAEPILHVTILIQRGEGRFSRNKWFD